MKWLIWDRKKVVYTVLIYFGDVEYTMLTILKQTSSISSIWQICTNELMHDKMYLFII